ncbi:hypothetical protein J6590_036237 [Homalodisca vitripennis]|nr:hypothetical protein J6590_036237 [Homalodisca vitripennis]
MRQGRSTGVNWQESANSTSTWLISRYYNTLGGRLLLVYGYIVEVKTLFSGEHNTKATHSSQVLGYIGLTALLELRTNSNFPTVN